MEQGGRGIRLCARSRDARESVSPRARVEAHRHTAQNVPGLCASAARRADARPLDGGQWTPHADAEVEAHQSAGALQRRDRRDVRWTLSLMTDSRSTTTLPAGKE